MYELRTKIDAPVNKGFYLEGSFLLYQSGKKLIKQNLDNNKILFEKEVNHNFQSIKPYKNGFICLSSSNYSILDNDLNIISDNKINYYEYRLISEEFLFSVVDYNYNTFEKKSGLYEIETRKNIWETDYNKGTLKSVDGINFFISSPTKIQRLNNEDGAIIWSYEINNKNFIPELLGVNDNLAFFGLQSIDKLIAIEITTGNIKWQKSTIIGGYFFDYKEKKIHQMMVNYTCVDLSTGENIDSYVDNDFFEKNKFETQRKNYGFIDNHIITTDFRKGTIGAFNTLTKEIDWKYESDNESFPATSPIVLNDKYLIVQNNKNSLNIFHRKQ
ncbi:PQQ-binding-like beta-propeller repeat protein [Maribacter sp. M208]|uniref:outer membrane protein assembly factor BamB family protein n=1 Tax=Maribacter huludaoensis TaxID=3030010 RepID=UPI0023EDD48A|nr:PQQ-binding-like beta-propeller repeat protein [Maribacter huludaoensis]MDF4223562.1 PQQ-binding-like beta-propeller repeat protein [Maribacter huludaoensis]